MKDKAPVSVLILKTSEPSAAIELVHFCLQSEHWRSLHTSATGFGENMPGDFS